RPQRRPSASRKAYCSRAPPRIRENSRRRVHKSRRSIREDRTHSFVRGSNEKGGDLPALSPRPVSRPGAPSWCSAAHFGGVTETSGPLMSFFLVVTVTSVGTLICLVLDFISTVGPLTSYFGTWPPFTCTSGILPS